jgi:hypothetical protein
VNTLLLVLHAVAGAKVAQANIVGMMIGRYAAAETDLGTLEPWNLGTLEP